MVLADSRQFSRSRRYLGTQIGVRLPFVYGALTLCGATFQNASTRHRFCNSVRNLVLPPSGPTTPNWQRHQALPPARFGLFPFRSPLLRESQLLSLPRGTQMFQFPRFPPLALFDSDQGHAPLRARGFPIRRSTDQSLVDGSPWLIAATHVLHRHLAPRHPPLALCSLNFALSSVLPREKKDKEIYLVCTSF